MKFAVASQNSRTVTGHAGKTRRFLVFEAESGSEPVEIDRLDMPKEMALHNYRGDDHPLYAMDVVIVGSCGEGFAQRLASYGVTVVNTEQGDPLQAVRDYFR
jgi:predicted Fe-Mo cluster-binding NifX family protein